MHWYVVSSQKEIRIFTKTLERSNLKILKTLKNPLGEVKKRELIRKQAGHGTKSIGRVGSVHYSETKRHDPHEEAVIQFAKMVAKFLEEEKLKKSFQSLSVIAEPHFLGKIRAELTRDLKGLVTQWIKKDLQKTPQKKLVELLLSSSNSIRSTAVKSSSVH